MKSWKTTTVGILGVVIALCTALVALWDGDDATEANWGAVVAAATVAVGLIFARDNDKTSEDAGAK